MSDKPDHEQEVANLRTVMLSRCPHPSGPCTTCHEHVGRFEAAVRASAVIEGNRFRSMSSTHTLPVNARHSTVLGYRADTSGRLMWKSLDWGWWFVDHLLDTPGCDYLHVRVKGDDGRVYRVRCRYSGGRYRGRRVCSVSLGFSGGQIRWIVRT